MNGRCLSALAIILLLLAFSTASAQESEPIDFDIFEADSFLVVWADLSPLTSSKRLEQLKQGIDLAIEYELSLLRPKKLWGTKMVSRVGGVLQISYKIVTEDFFLQGSLNDTILERSFITLEKLQQFLTDSVTFPLSRISDLDASGRYFITLRLTCISLTSLNLAADGETPDGSESAVKYLFEKFLDVTNFGREEFELKSRLFSLPEIGTQY